MPRHWRAPFSLLVSVFLLPLCSFAANSFENTAVVRTVELGGSLVSVTTTYAIRALEDGHVSSFRIRSNAMLIHLRLQLASVGLDVYPDEPQVNPRLLEFDNITLLPHMGTETRDSQKKMEIRALSNLKDYLTQGSGKDLVWELK